MLAHLSLSVADLHRAAAFYDAVLEPLGCVRLWTTRTAVGYGPAGSAAASDKLALIESSGRAEPGSGFHLAFAATSREAVDAFHAAAMQAGAIDDGAPGLRPHYGAGYYAAFVVDLDGHAIEAVFHGTT